MKAALGILMLIALASPAAAQVRLFTDGHIVKIGPTKAERRASQMGVMRGAMSGRALAPDANKSAPAPDANGANSGANKPALAPNQGIIRGVERAR